LKTGPSTIFSIAVVTSSRADYGILKPLLNKLKDAAKVELQLIVTGSHLDKNNGNTIQQISNDGFKIDYKIKSGLTKTDTLNITNSIGKLVQAYAKVFSKSKPSRLVLLGDRYEIFSAAIAAYVFQIPIVHIHGGEVSSGSFDEGFRHSITKLAALHFVICETYRKRVIQLGEEPSTVFNVGALAIDNVKNSKLLSRTELEKELNFSLGNCASLITYHPVTLEKHTSLKHLEALLKALDSFPEMALIFNSSNADTDGDLLNERIKKYVRKRNNAVLIPSLGTHRFLSTLKEVNLMIGNSSAGLIEMPYFKKPTINIGDRQLGRYKPKGVIDVDTTTEHIVKAIKLGLSKSFVTKTSKLSYPFGDGLVADKILTVLLKTKNQLSVKKSFYDL
jgi:GDP/UDP-N,N'-diacetylbacillosamine 2-epimerase (hydrolysing)